MRIHTNRTLTAAAVFLFPILENTGGLLFVLTVHTEYFTDCRPRQIDSTSTLPPLNTHPVWSPILDCDVIFSSSSHVLPDILTTTFCPSLPFTFIPLQIYRTKPSQARHHHGHGHHRQQEQPGHQVPVPTSGRRAGQHHSPSPGSRRRHCQVDSFPQHITTTQYNGIGNTFLILPLLSFKIKKKTHFRKLMTSYCNRKQLDFNAVRFM